MKPADRNAEIAHVIHWIVCALLAVIIIVVIGEANADVIVQTPVGESTKSKAALVAADKVLWCESGGPLVAYGNGAPRNVNGSKLCGNEVWYSVSNMQSQSWTLTDTGWYRFVDVPKVATPVPTLPRKPYECTPSKEAWATEARIVKRGDAAVGIWYCDKPRGIVAHAFCGDPKNIPDGPMTHAALVGLVRAKRPCTSAEVAIAAEIPNLKAYVKNGTSTTAPAYKANDDGTRALRSTSRVNVDTECNWTMRLVDSKGKGTNYYAVVGIPGPLYANCEIDGPIIK